MRRVEWIYLTSRPPRIRTHREMKCCRILLDELSMMARFLTLGFEKSSAFAFCGRPDSPGAACIAHSSLSNLPPLVDACLLVVVFAVPFPTCTCLPPDIYRMQWRQGTNSLDRGNIGVSRSHHCISCVALVAEKEAALCYFSVWLTFSWIACSGILSKASFRSFFRICRSCSCSSWSMTMQAAKTVKHISFKASPS